MFGKNKTKPHTIRVVDDLKFIGEFDAEKQIKWLDKHNNIRADEINELKNTVENLESTLNSVNKQNGELRAAISEIAAWDKSKQKAEAHRLLEHAAAEIRALRKIDSDKSLRLGVFDDVMALFKSGRAGGNFTGRNLIESDISNFLNQ